MEAIVARTLNGHVLQVRARAYVLACGGIENARLLLASNRVAPAGIGNEYDLVGRFFMDHPYLTTGYFAPASQQHADGPHVIQSFKRAGLGQKCHIGFVLSERVRRDEQLTGAAPTSFAASPRRPRPSISVVAANRDCALPSFSNIARRRVQILAVISALWRRAGARSG